MELEIAKVCIEEQLVEELVRLSELLLDLEIPMLGKDLLQFSGLSLSTYTVKGKYKYIKLTAVKTGDRTTRIEGWKLQKIGEKRVRKRWLRRETVHLKNLRWTEENEKNLKLLLHYWRRAKALNSWLKEIEAGETHSIQSNQE